MSLAIWDHTVTFHPTQVNTPRLNKARCVHLCRVEGNTTLVVSFEVTFDGESLIAVGVPHLGSSRLLRTLGNTVPIVLVRISHRHFKYFFDVSYW